MRTILHIDFDSFFASVEQQYHPEFRHRPLGVTATNGRTCIIAASREAKKMGVKSPSITYQAQQICPQIIFTKANFNLYWEVSKKFILICKDFSPYVEIFSLDEVFMDVTQTVHLFGGVEQVIRKIKQRLITELGEYITASFGISHNKMLAKLGSGLHKPNGIVFIRPQDVQSIYGQAKLSDICGIGRRIEERLVNMGIRSLSDLSRTPLPPLIAEFGNIEGHFLKNVGLGVDEAIVVPYTDAPETKSVGRNYCLPYNQYDHKVVLQNVYELCEEVCLKLRRLEKKARHVGIFLRGTENMGGGKTVQNYFDRAPEMYELCLRVLGRDWDGYMRQIGVYASFLEDSRNVPLDIFDGKRKETIVKIIDNINDKYGDHTIRNGFLLYADKLTTVPNGYGSDRLERVKFANS